MNGLRARREGIGRPQISHQNLYVIQLLNELQQFMTQPGAHEALLPSITHLSSLRDRHPTANYYMNLVIDELDQNQVRQGRPSMRAAPTLLPHDSFN